MILPADVINKRVIDELAVMLFTFKSFNYFLCGYALFATIFKRRLAD